MATSTTETFGRVPSDMLNYSDTIRKDPSTIKILSFLSFELTFVRYPIVATIFRRHLQLLLVT